jgi:hypothetical protein
MIQTTSLGYGSTGKKIIFGKRLMTKLGGAWNAPSAIVLLWVTAMKAIVKAQETQQCPVRMVTTCGFGGAKERTANMNSELSRMRDQGIKLE